KKQKESEKKEQLIKKADDLLLQYFKALVEDYKKYSAIGHKKLTLTEYLAQVRDFSRKYPGKLEYFWNMRDWIKRKLAGHYEGGKIPETKPRKPNHGKMREEDQSEIFAITKPMQPNPQDETRLMKPNPAEMEKEDQRQSLPPTFSRKERDPRLQALMEKLEKIRGGLLTHEGPIVKSAITKVERNSKEEKEQTTRKGKHIGLQAETAYKTGRGWSKKNFLTTKTPKFEKSKVTKAPPTLKGAFRTA
ncbi:unnamed protein product, partial [Cylicostephanus goldi]